ncbi:MAG: glycosyltransferase [Chloroflexota bacterium]|nr:glycosyltransferase [Chloroflexota bacterium]
MRYQFKEITPENTIFVLISFEGPDRYSMAGGLGVRVTELSEALAETGFETHVFFVGSADAAEYEVLEDNRYLWRICQQISGRCTQGVYQGEDEKLEAFERDVPPLLLSQIARPAQESGKLLVIMGEDWHTAATMAAISDLLYWQGLRSHAVMLWNANSIFGFDHIDWARLQLATRITCVSRYMKHLLWPYGVNALVLPNGIPARHLQTVPHEDVQRLTSLLKDRMILTKVARFDPDKNWIPAVQAIARLCAVEEQPLFFMRGGIEGYGAKVLGEVENLGLRRKDFELEMPSVEEFLRAMAVYKEEADVIYFRHYIPEEIQRLLYRTSHAVLANSAHEPFGLVGLEVMGAEGVAFVGSTGEGYAQHLLNAISLDTTDPNEIVGYLLYMRHHPHVTNDIRRIGRITARYYIWPRIIEKIISKLQYLLMAGGNTWP